MNNINSNKPIFDFVEMPNAYLCDNPRTNKARQQMIKNQIRIASDYQGNLEQVFFSDENMDLINKQLILSVWTKTNKTIKIGPQSKENLLIVMRYIFIEFARHLPYDIAGQIRELNCMVVNEILPLVITNADQRIGYLRDIERFQDPVPLPINVKNLNKSLPSTANIILDVNLGRNNLDGYSRQQ